MKPSGLIILGCVTVAIAIAGLIMTLQWPAQAREIQRRIDRKQEDIRILAALNQKMARGNNVVALFASLPVSQPTDPMNTIRATVPAVQAEVRDLGVLPSVPGWQRHRVTTAFKDVAYEDLLRMTQAFETGRPPWRVTGLTLQAGQQSGRALGVSLTLEALEKIPTETAPLSRK